MNRNSLWVVGKSLEGLGLVITLWGLVYGIVIGMREEGLRSMSVELGALGVGLAVFFLGRLVESRA